LRLYIIEQNGFFRTKNLLNGMPVLIGWNHQYDEINYTKNLSKIKSTESWVLSIAATDRLSLPKREYTA